MRCSENMACRFYHYSFTKTCILYTSCEQLRTTRDLGTTISIDNEGILSFIFWKCNIFNILIWFLCQMIVHKGLSFWLVISEDCPIGYTTKTDCQAPAICCVTNWSNHCDEHCALARCLEAGGKWIPKDNNVHPYACEIGITCGSFCSFRLEFEYKFINVS